MSNSESAFIKQDLFWLYDQLGLSQQAILRVEAERNAQPARLVRGGAGNVIVRYPSRKIGGIVQSESHQLEFVASYLMEHNKDVLELYDQPQSFVVQYVAKSGKRAAFLYTPDFFVIRKNSITWEEWKPQKKLEKAAEKMPNRYILGDDGLWYCPPAEEYAFQFGLQFRIHTETEIDRVFFRNILFLEDYLHVAPLSENDEWAVIVTDVVASNPGIRLDELLVQLKHLAGYTQGTGGMRGTADAENPEDAEKESRNRSLAWSGNMLIKVPNKQQAAIEALYNMIAHRRLYVRLGSDPLAEPDRVPVYRSEAECIAYQYALGPSSTGVSSTKGDLGEVTENVDYARYRDNHPLGIVAPITSTVSAYTDPLPPAHALASESPTSSSSSLQYPSQSQRQMQPEAQPKSQQSGQVSSQARELLDKAGPAELEEATRRYHIIRPFLDGTPLTEQALAANRVPEVKRTIYHWLECYRRAEVAYSSGFVGLLSHKARRGNRTPKLPLGTIEVMNEYIAHGYETVKREGMFNTYCKVVRACEVQGLLIPSYKSFSQAVKMRPHYEQVLKREGRRAAYQYQPPDWDWYINMSTPRHGDRPFEVAHMDHTELEIELVHSRTRQNMGRPWLTTLLDAYTRRVLAVYLTYEAPSAESCMMALRECVRRFCRLPQIIIVDGGKEFGSIAFETFLARYEVTKKTRPPAQARFGSLIERLFRTVHSQFIHVLLGNTQATKQVRQMTEETNPKAQAIWTLGRLYNRLCEWAYDVYDTLPHPALGQSPRAVFEQGIERTGIRLGRAIEYSKEFIRDSMPATRKGTAKVQARDGIKVNGIYYWCNLFSLPGVEGHDVPVHYDPWDAGIVYAYLHGEWRECVSEHYSAFKGRSEREVMRATEELRKKNHLMGSKAVQLTTIRARADFMSSLDAEEALLKQQLRDSEAYSVHSRILGYTASAGNPNYPDLGGYHDSAGFQPGASEGGTDGPSTNSVNPGSAAKNVVSKGPNEGDNNGQYAHTSSKDGNSTTSNGADPNSMDSAGQTRARSHDEHRERRFSQDKYEVYEDY